MEKLPCLPQLLCLPLFTLLALTSSCSGAKKEVESPTASPLPLPTLEELLPLKDSTVSNFATKSDLGEEGIFVLEIYRPRPDLAELKIAGRVQRLYVEKHRVSHASGGVLLQLPLEVGQTFQGSFGEVRIEQVNHSLTVPAGTLTRCVTTVEESTQPPKRSTSVYCADVGLAQMSVESFGAEEGGSLSAQLLQHGPRVDLRAEPPQDPEDPEQK